MDLHILKIKEDKWGTLTYTDYALVSEDFAKWFTTEIKESHSKDGQMIIVSLDGNEYSVKNDYDGAEYGSLKGVTYGDGEVIDFYFNEGKDIMLQIAIGFRFDKTPVPVYFGEVKAKVKFVDGRFELSDYAFTANDWTAHG